MDADMLTVFDVAKLLKVSRWMVYQLIWSNQLASVQIGRCRRVPRDSYEAYRTSLMTGVNV